MHLLVTLEGVHHFTDENTCIPVADYVKFKNKIKFKIFKKKKKKLQQINH